MHPIEEPAEGFALEPRPEEETQKREAKCLQDPVVVDSDGLQKLFRSLLGLLDSAADLVDVLDQTGGLFAVPELIGELVERSTPGPGWKSDAG
jgi:hypothetical protein